MSISCRKTKTKEVTTTNQSKEEKPHAANEVKATQLLEAREDAGDQVAGDQVAGDQVAMIGFSFQCDWLKKWREFTGPITFWSRENPTQFPIH